MADDARARKRGESEREATALSEESVRVASIERIISGAIPEFIASARELGVKPQGLLNRRWLVSLGLSFTSGGDGFLWTIDIAVRPDGTWAFTNGLRAHEDNNLNETTVREAFAHWLSRQMT